MSTSRGDTKTARAAGPRARATDCRSTSLRPCTRVRAGRSIIVDAHLEIQPPRGDHSVESWRAEAACAIHRLNDIWLFEERCSTGAARRTETPRRSRPRKEHASSCTLWAMGNTEPLCDWKKEAIDAQFDLLLSIVRKPRYVCRKCARVANDEKWLCKPRPIPVDSARDPSELPER